MPDVRAPVRDDVDSDKAGLDGASGSIKLLAGGTRATKLVVKEYHNGGHHGEEDTEAHDDAVTNTLRKGSKRRSCEIDHSCSREHDELAQMLVHDCTSHVIFRVKGEYASR